MLTRKPRSVSLGALPVLLEGGRGRSSRHLLSFSAVGFVLVGAHEVQAVHGDVLVLDGLLHAALVQPEAVRARLGASLSLQELVGEPSVETLVVLPLEFRASLAHAVHLPSDGKTHTIAHQKHPSRIGKTLCYGYVTRSTLGGRRPTSQPSKDLEGKTAYSFVHRGALKTREEEKYSVFFFQSQTNSKHAVITPVCVNHEKRGFPPPAADPKEKRKKKS